MSLGCLSDAEAANVDGVEINGTIQLYEPELSGTAQGKISKPSVLVCMDHLLVLLSTKSFPL